MAHDGTKCESGKKRVLFLCTGNSCRSQMAEGFLRHLAGNRFEAFSAGTEPSKLHPGAVEAMAEAGVDIAGQRSKGIAEYDGVEFDAVITVCDRARESCPVFPGGGERLHWSFDDPAAAAGSDDERRAVFRRVRDEIRERIEAFVAPLEETHPRR